MIFYEKQAILSGFKVNKFYVSLLVLDVERLLLYDIYIYV